MDEDAENSSSHQRFRSIVLKSLASLILAATSLLLFSTGCAVKEEPKPASPTAPLQSRSICTKEFSAEYDNYRRLLVRYERPEVYLPNRQLTTTEEMRASCERALTNMGSYTGGRNCFLVTSSGADREAYFEGDRSFCKRLLAGEEYPQY